MTQHPHQHEPEPSSVERSSTTSPSNDNLHSTSHSGTPFRGVISFVAECGSFITLKLREDLSDEEFMQFLSGVWNLIVKYDKALDVVPSVSISWARRMKWLPSESEKQLPSYPEDLTEFFPHTGGDFFLHVKSEARDVCWDFGRDIELLSRDVRDKSSTSTGLPEQESNSVHGSLTKTCVPDHGIEVVDTFMYQLHKKTKLGKDLSQFEDGTENPKTNEERQFWACNEAGGSFVLPQKWLHDKLDSFLRMKVEEQEGHIGRTKEGSVELDPLKDHSHVNRVTIDDENGEEIKVVRHSAPWGNLKQFGLFFIAYSKDLQVLETQLRNMADVRENGPDGVFAISSCLSGEFFYAPSQEQVQEAVRLVGKL